MLLRLGFKRADMAEFKGTKVILQTQTAGPVSVGVVAEEDIFKEVSVLEAFGIQSLLGDRSGSEVPRSGAA